MKKKEIIDKILQYHPNIEHYHGCDEYKFFRLESMMV